MSVGTEKLYTEARQSLERVQNFEANSLRRTEELGVQLNFDGAVEPAQRLIELFRRLSPDALQDFPDQALNEVKNQADNAYALFKQVLTFSADSNNPKSERQSTISNIQNAYAQIFTSLHPLISYSLHRSADFQRLDLEARATLQSIEDRANNMTAELAKHEADAKRVLEEIRKVAAEEGVSQQAAHFRTESELHAEDAETWRKRTVRVSWMLGVLAILSVFAHKIPALRPESTYDTVQLGISKFLVFAVITYMLVLSARNFMSHKHNAIVNKHRQNALMTHKALIEGTEDSGARDAVMIHAASCVFSPQSTGYAQPSADGDSSSPRSVVELASRSAASSAKQLASQ